MKVIPVGNRVLIKQVEAAETTKTGLYIPEGEQRRQKQGVVVVAVGVHPDMAYSVGDVLLTVAHQGRPVLIDKTAHLVLDCEYIVARLEM